MTAGSLECKFPVQQIDYAGTGRSAHERRHTGTDSTQINQRNQYQVMHDSSCSAGQGKLGHLPAEAGTFPDFSCVCQVFRHLKIQWLFIVAQNPESIGY
jgi:hypothetical protein